MENKNNNHIISVVNKKKVLKIFWALDKVIFLLKTVFETKLNLDCLYIFKIILQIPFINLILRNLSLEI